MSRKIRDTGEPPRRVRGTGGHLPPLDSALVAAALGAEPAEAQVRVGQGPVSLFAVREEVARCLTEETTGGVRRSLRAALAEAFHRWLAAWLPEAAHRSALAALKSAGAGDPKRAEAVAQEIALQVLAQFEGRHEVPEDAIPFSWEETDASVENWLSQLVGMAAQKVVRAS